MCGMWVSVVHHDHLIEYQTTPPTIYNIKNYDIDYVFLYNIQCSIVHVMTYSRSSINIVILGL